MNVSNKRPRVKHLFTKLKNIFIIRSNFDLPVSEKKIVSEAFLLKVSDALFLRFVFFEGYLHRPFFPFAGKDADRKKVQGEGILPALFLPEIITVVN